MIHESALTLFDYWMSVVMWIGDISHVSLGVLRRLGIYVGYRGKGGHLQPCLGFLGSCARAMLGVVMDVAHVAMDMITIGN